MRHIYAFIVSVLTLFFKIKGENVVKTVVSAHTVVDSTRVCFVCYQDFHVDIITLIFLGFIVLFFIVQVVWQINYNTDPKVRKYYKTLKVIMHCIFGCYFLYSAIAYHHYGLVFIEVLVYIGVEIILEIIHSKNH